MILYLSFFLIFCSSELSLAGGPLHQQKVIFVEEEMVFDQEVIFSPSLEVEEKQILKAVPSLIPCLYGFKWIYFQLQQFLFTAF